MSSTLFEEMFWEMFWRRCIVLYRQGVKKRGHCSVARTSAGTNGRRRRSDWSLAATSPRSVIARSGALDACIHGHVVSVAPNELEHRFIEGRRCLPVGGMPDFGESDQ